MEEEDDLEGLEDLDNDEDGSGEENATGENAENTSSNEEAQHQARKHRRLTEAEKVEIRELFELGKRRMTELADQYGVTRQALSNWFKKDGIVYGCRAHELKGAVSSAIKNSTERYAEQRLNWIEETRLQAYKDLKQAALIAKKVVADAIQASRPLATADDDLKAVHRYHRILQQNVETRLDLLDAHNTVSEDDLPKLIIDDLTAEKLKQFHQDNGIDDQDEIDEILENFEKGA